MTDHRNDSPTIRPVRIYRLTSDGPEYVCTDELANGDPLRALYRRFGRGADIMIVENRPFEGDVWSVASEGSAPGRYLTRRTLIEGGADD